MSVTDPEVERMLLWFKAQLPPHDLGDWQITQHSMDRTVIEGSVGVQPMYDEGYVRIRGHARCLRCGRRFDIPDLGNWITRPERVEITVARAKEWVESIAEREGPCWGDVPELERRYEGAVLDAAD